MFNISNLLNSQVQTTPWNHQSVSGFFDTESLAKINTGLQLLLDTLDSNTTYDGSTGITIYQAKDLIGQEAFDIILDANEAILDSINDIFDKYPGHRSYSSIMCVPSISVIAPNHEEYINDSAVDKVCNIVSFVTPDVTVETLLYPENDVKSESTVVTNQANTGMVSCPESGVTWFQYSPVSSRYVTINFFVCKNVFDSLTVVGNNYQYTNMEGQIVDIPKDAASDATVAAAQSGKLVRNLG